MDVGREFIARKDGTLQRVVSEDGELVLWETQQRHEAERAARRCACGRPCGSGSAQTCGSRECIRSLVMAAKADTSRDTGAGA